MVIHVGPRVVHEATFEGLIEMNSMHQEPIVFGQVREP